jgi:hypothetical protein
VKLLSLHVERFRCIRKAAIEFGGVGDSPANSGAARGAMSTLPEARR